jgi:hypothetical protein
MFTIKAYDAHDRLIDARLSVDASDVCTLLEDEPDAIKMIVVRGDTGEVEQLRASLLEH